MKNSEYVSAGGFVGGSATQMWLAVAGKDRACGGMEYVKRWFIPDCLSMQRYTFSEHTKSRWRFRSTLRVSRNDVPHTGRKREKMGGGDDVSGNGALSPAAHLFPFPHPAAHVIPPPTLGGGGTPTLQESIVRRRHFPSKARD